MISNEIIKIASNTSYVGLKNDYTYKSSKKNLMCGDLIKVELVVNKSKINSMRYESESCIYCNASASLIAKHIRGLSINKVKKDLNKLRSFSMDLKSFQIPIKFKKFKSLFKKTNTNRLNCIFLPLDAVLKALK
jgi:nitrogen fixation NifU-like protein